MVYLVLNLKLEPLPILSKKINSLFRLMYSNNFTLFYLIRFKGSDDILIPISQKIPSGSGRIIRCRESK